MARQSADERGIFYEKDGNGRISATWISRICDLNDSEMTQEEWSKQHGIAYSTLRYWISKLKKEAVSENSETNWPNEYSGTSGRRFRKYPDTLPAKLIVKKLLHFGNKY